MNNRSAGTRGVGLLCAGVLFSLTAAVSASSANGGFDRCLPSQIRISVTNPHNAFTGGNYPLF